MPPAIGRTSSRDLDPALPAEPRAGLEAVQTDREAMEMAGSPKYKVYTASGDYEAACKSLEVAAAVVALLGDGATVRLHHRQVLWTEGIDGEAGESYDGAALVMARRLPPEWQPTE